MKEHWAQQQAESVFNYTAGSWFGFKISVFFSSEDEGSCLCVCNDCCSPFFRDYTLKKPHLTKQIVKLPQSEFKWSRRYPNRSFSTLLNPKTILHFGEEGVKNHQINMCCVGRMIVIYKNLDETLKEWSLTIPSLCDLFAGLCGNASVSLLFIHLLQLLPLFLSPGSHRHKLRNWYWEIVSPKAHIKATPGWLTTEAAKKHINGKKSAWKWKKKAQQGGRG